MKINDHDDRQEDNECLSPELAAFELQLKSLKPVAVRLELPGISQKMAAGNVVSAANEVTGSSHRTIRSLRYAPFPAAIMFPVAIVLATALTLLIALTLYWQMQTPDQGNEQYIVENNDPQPPGDPLHDVQEHTTDPTSAYASVQRQNGVSPDVFRGGLTMRKQLAMLLDEMQPTSTVAMEPKRPDYPVMIIPVRQDAPPLSPEAKQAFQRRLQRIDFEI